MNSGDAFLFLVFQCKIMPECSHGNEIFILIVLIFVKGIIVII